MFLKIYLSHKLKMRYQCNVTEKPKNWLFGFYWLPPPPCAEHSNDLQRNLSTVRSSKHLRRGISQLICTLKAKPWRKRYMIQAFCYRFIAFFYIQVCSYVVNCLPRGLVVSKRVWMCPRLFTDLYEFAVCREAVYRPPGTGWAYWEADYWPLRGCEFIYRQITDFQKGMSWFKWLIIDGH
jgi:hypothetical protein